MVKGKGMFIDTIADVWNMQVPREANPKKLRYGVSKVKFVIRNHHVVLLASLFSSSFE